MTDPPTDADLEALVAEAWRVRERAYAPYSGFAVGAAALTDAGVFAGTNVENAAYSAGICAERSALVAAVSGGARRIRAVAVAAVGADPSSLVTPCGLCRQFLREFGLDIVVVSEAPDGTRRRWTVADLLPDSFGPEVLTDATAEGDDG